MNRDDALTTLKEGLPFTKIDCVPNQLVAVQGDQSGLIYHLESGWTKLSKISRDGKENCIDLCAPGEFIGLPTLFNPPEFPVNITAITFGRLQAVKKNLLEAFILLHPQIMAVLFADLGETVLKLRGAKLAATQEDAYAQVRDLLVHFANIFGIDIPSGRLIPVNLTQQEIADFIGLSRPRVSICLKNLLDLGFIHRQGKYYVLSNSAPDSSTRRKGRWAEAF